MKNKNITIILLLIGIAVTSGCATTPHETSISADLSDQIKDATVLVLVKDEGITANVQKTNTGASYGLVGAILDARKNGKAMETMKTNAARISENAGDLNFGTDLRAAIVSNHIFKDDSKIRLVYLDAGDDDKAREKNREKVRDNVKSAPPGPVVTIRSELKMDATFRVMIMQSAAYLWNSPRDEAQRITITTYQSESINASAKRSLKQEDIEKMSNLWANDNAIRFRDAYKAGLAEITGMLRVAIIERPSSLPTANDKNTTYVDYSITPDPYYFNWKQRNAKLIHDNGSRLIALTEEGELLSLPENGSNTP